MKNSKKISQQNIKTRNRLIRGKGAFNPIQLKKNITSLFTCF